MLHWKLAEKMTICILSSCVALKNEWEKIQLLQFYMFDKLKILLKHHIVNVMEWKKWLTFSITIFQNINVVHTMKKKYPGNMNANDTWYFKTKKSFFETNISFQTTLKNYYEMGGNTLVLFSHFYQN